MIGIDADDIEEYGPHDLLVADRTDDATRCEPAGCGAKIRGLRAGLKSRRLDEVARINQQGWDRRVEEQDVWTVPCLPMRSAAPASATGRRS